MRKQWFSFSAVFVVESELEGVLNESRSVYLLRAKDWTRAFAIALERARQDEREYRNIDDTTIWWRLAEIETLDKLGKRILPGREVYSQPMQPRPEWIAVKRPELRPEISIPTNSGV